ncbi:MAG TPA: BrnA antitoxin family protein [Pyrinomonadaceae bacterium]|nr:BrnA antitoxin family protein [Pyrinomonadaceae bacterium]
MSASDLKKPSETNWTRVDAITEEEIDTSDIPPLDEAFFAHAKLRVPEKVSITVNVDADVLEWFRAQGEEFQQRINAALRIYAEAHKEHRQ